jgi:hypothetical protein
MEQIKHDIELQIADWRAKATLHCSNSLIPRTCLVRTPVIKTLSPSDLQLRMFIASQPIQAIVYYGSIAFIQYPDGDDRWFVYRHKTYVDCMSDLEGALDITAGRAAATVRASAKGKKRPALKYSAEIRGGK